MFAENPREHPIRSGRPASGRPSNRRQRSWSISKHSRWPAPL